MAELIDRIEKQYASPKLQIDIRSFLFGHQEEPFPIDEKLRFLAIALERNQWDWQVVRGVYDAGIDENPRNIELLHSLAISAKWYSNLDSDAEKSRQFYWEAYDALEKAIALNHDDPQTYYLLGNITYNDRSKSKSDSLQWLNQCLDLDPEHPWANLYRAHCLHDEEHWLEAANAYDQVNPGAFTGPICWRYEHLLEQRAYCRFRGGEIATARKEFMRLLERWESDPSLLAHAYLWGFVEVAKSSFREELSDRAKILFGSVESDGGFYQGLLTGED